MKRKRINKILNRKGNNQGLFPSWNKYEYTFLYSRLICNSCLSAYQESVYEYQKSFIFGIKKCWKDEIMKFFRERMYINRYFIQLATKYMSDLDVFMNGLSILTAFKDVFPVRMNICIPAFRAWIKRCKSLRNKYLDTGIHESIALWSV